VSQKPSGCPTCEVLRDEVRWLRDELRALRVSGTTPAPATPLGPPQVGVSLAPGPTEEMLKQAGIFADESGQAMVLVDGQAVPLTEYRRGQRALEQAMAGKPIETEGP
jgi:hypothetical protein